MSPQTRREMKVQAVTGNGKGEGFTTTEVVYKLADDVNVDGFGEFFTYEASKEIIGMYWEDLKKPPKEIIQDGLDLDDRIVAIEIGKEMLLMILSQSGCQGIRFYSGRGVNVDTDNKGIRTFTPKQPGKNTLVAIGMDANGNDLGVALENEDDTSKFKNISIMSPGTKKAQDESIKSETNPPKTKGEIEKGITAASNKKHTAANKYGLENAFVEYKSK